MDANEKLLETVLKRWAEICRENEAHRPLVTEQEWDQWESFKQTRIDRIRTILNSEESLSQSEVDFLKSLESSIGSAHHMTESELMERRDREVQEELETKRAEADANALARVRVREVSERKNRRGALLRILFGG